jgi:hypothetical protein
MVGRSYYDCLSLLCNYVPFEAKAIRRSPRTIVNDLVVMITEIIGSTLNDVSVVQKSVVNHSRLVCTQCLYNAILGSFQAMLRVFNNVPSR